MSISRPVPKYNHLMYVCKGVCYSLVDIAVLHPPVELGQFDGEDDAGDQEDHTPAQTEPEPILDTNTDVGQ